MQNISKHDHSDPWNHLEPYPGMPSIRGLQIQLRLAHHCGDGYQPMECSGGEHGGSQHGLVLAMHIWQDSVLSLEMSGVCGSHDFLIFFVMCQRLGKQFEYTQYILQSMHPNTLFVAGSQDTYWMGWVLSRPTVELHRTTVPCR